DTAGASKGLIAKPTERRSTVRPDGGEQQGVPEDQPALYRQPPPVESIQSVSVPAAGSPAPTAQDLDDAEGKRATVPSDPTHVRSASAAVGNAPGPRRGLLPGNTSDLYERAYALWSTVWASNDRHSVTASRWGLLDTWARLVLALIAALSAVTLISEQPNTALGFAIATAVFSAINAALDPAARS